MYILNRLPKAMKPQDLERRSADAVTLLKALSNENRLKILCHLIQGEKCVGELDSIIGLGQSALSQHLAVLRNENLVKTRRNKQTIYYTVNGPETQAIMETLHQVFSKPETAA